MTSPPTVQASLLLGLPDELLLHIIKPLCFIGDHGIFKMKNAVVHFYGSSGLSRDAYGEEFEESVTTSKTKLGLALVCRKFKLIVYEAVHSQNTVVVRSTKEAYPQNTPSGYNPFVYVYGVFGDFGDNRGKRYTIDKDRPLYHLRLPSPATRPYVSKIEITIPVPHAPARVPYIDGRYIQEGLRVIFDYDDNRSDWFAAVRELPEMFKASQRVEIHLELGSYWADICNSESQLAGFKEWIGRKLMAESRVQEMIKEGKLRVDIVRDDWGV